MTELYLRLLDRIMTPILLLLALFLLLRGHNLPGGGFIAGLVVAAAFELQILSRGSEVVRKNIGPYLQPMTSFGLIVAALSAVAGVFAGTFFTGLWWEISLGPLHFELSTPMTFDIGVFLVVLSIVTSYLLGLSQQE
ncbi:MAG: MnhB domain-containing protein [Chloroflexota bacterium]